MIIDIKSWLKYIVSYAHRVGLLSLTTKLLRKGISQVIWIYHEKPLSKASKSKIPANLCII